MGRMPKWDDEILKLAARVKFVDAELVAKRIGMSPRNANMRFRSLVKEGSLKRWTQMKGPWLYSATWLGLRIVNQENFHPPRFSFASIEHDQAIANLAVECELRGHRCLTERALGVSQRLDEDDRYIFCVFSDSRSIRHYPDLTIESPDGKYFVAIEIELSEKSRRRTRNMLHAYGMRAISGNRGGFLGAIYLTGPKCSKKRIRDLSDSLDLTDSVVVDRYEQYPAQALQRLRVMLLAQKHREEGFVDDRRSSIRSKWEGPILPDSVLDFLRPRNATGTVMSAVVRARETTGYGLPAKWV